MMCPQTPTESSGHKVDRHSHTQGGGADTVRSTLSQCHIKPGTLPPIFKLCQNSEFNLLNMVNGGLVSGHAHVMVLAHYAQGPLEGGAKG